MTRRRAVKQPKRPSTKKITGTITKLTPNQITVATAKGVWIINRTPRPKVSGGTLRLLSTVTIEFNKNHGRLAARGAPGKRTETGTVIKLSLQQIMLDNTSPDPQTWIVNRTTDNQITGTLMIGSIVTVSSKEQDWQQVVA